MIEVIVKEHLEQQLQVPVYMEYPKNAPARFVVLKKSDSSREDLIDAAMFVADSYAESMYEAARLNAQVVAALDALADLDSIGKSERGGDYAFFDTANKRHRYQAVQTITHY